MSQKKIAAGIERIRKHYRVVTRVYPETPCNKCGSLAWDPDFYEDIHSWYCLKCGNRGFWEGSVYRQGSK